MFEEEKQAEKKEHQPTPKQLVVFGIAMSFVVSVIGTVLAIGVLGPLFFKDEGGGSFVLNRPTQVIERIIGGEELENPEPAEPLVLPSHEELVVQVVERASPAVVSVVATKDVPVIEQFFVDPFGSDPFFRQFFGDDTFRIPQFRQRGTQKQQVSAGTGFFVSSDGLILTNKHVVEDRDAEYTVFMNDGKKKQAKVLARDPVQDIAILKVEGGNYPTLPFGDSAKIKIGQSVIAIGNALGEFRNTVSVGIISGLHRTVVARGATGGPESLQELIQTDAAINPGNSGGPLLDLRGAVIGMNTAMAQGAENIGFTIPINSAKRGIESVRKLGKIVYPFLGVRYALVNKDIAETQKLGRDYGALVVKGESDPAITSGSPAEKAGIKEGDIILEFGGERVDTDHTLASLIQKHQVDEEVTIKVFRSGQEITLKVKLEERKQ